MNTADIIEERITITSGDLALAGILGYPGDREPKRAVLICSPHPHFAGNMDNNVVTDLARTLAHDAVTLRFDYRGVGTSEIALAPGLSGFDYWQSVAEDKNYTDALDDTTAAAAELMRVAAGLPMIAAGYSFGAFTALHYGCTNTAVTRMIGISPPLKRVAFPFLADCAKPCLLVSGSADFVCAPTDISDLATGAGPRVTAETLNGNDHFFRGEENVLSACVAAFINQRVFVTRSLTANS